MRPFQRLLTSLSLSRIAVAAAIILIFDPNSMSSVISCLILYALGHLTDHLDGFIARKFSSPNDEGFMLDSVSDKLFQIGSLIPIHLYFDVTILLFWLVLVREFFVTALFSFVDFGNEKTVVQISRYSYVFVGLIRLVTFIYLALPVIQNLVESEIVEHIQTAAFLGYVAAVIISSITIFDMYTASKRRSPNKLVRRPHDRSQSNS